MIGVKGSVILKLSNFGVAAEVGITEWGVFRSWCFD
jgi:hypothetical protein